MPFIGNKPAQVPLTSADIADGIITSAKIVDGTIVNADINASAAIVSTKLSGVQGKFESALLHVRDEKASNNHAGTFTGGSFVKRDLNTTLTNEISGASISSSVITLPAGTYFIFASAPGFNVYNHKLKLRNTTDSSDTLIGTSEYAEAGTYNSTKSFVIGRFTISAEKTFELQHRCNQTQSNSGLGHLTNFSVVEVYADVQIWKIS
jgi:hypothetical protein